MVSLSQIGGWFKEKSEKILVSSVFCFALALAFISGAFYARDQKPSSRLVITVPDYKQATLEAQKKKLESETSSEKSPGESISAPQTSDRISAKEGMDDCPYLGSKNSDKYHLASCGVVKRIKPENIRCFTSTEAAEAAGYKPGCLK